MKSFDEWFKQPIAPLIDQQEAEENMAEEKGLSDCVGHWSARCCENHYEIMCSVEEFDPDFSYCGGSERCLP